MTSSTINRNNERVQILPKLWFPTKERQKGGETEEDETIGRKYCSLCYETGSFVTPPEIDTADRIQKFCIKEMKKHGINGFFEWLVSRSIPKLERWNK